MHINVFLSKIIQLKRSQTRANLILIILAFFFQLHFAEKKNPQKKERANHESLQISLN